MLRTREENKLLAMESFERRRFSELSEDDYQKKYAEYIKYIPARYADVSRDDIPPKVAEHADLLNGKKNGLYIWGQVGCGKTHTLYALKKYYAERLLLLKVENMTEVLGEIKRSFKTDEPRDIMDFNGYGDWGKIASCVAYDDIGSEKDTDWAGEQMYRLIDFIYTKKDRFILTSNLSLKDLSERYGGTQGDRIASRIAEMATIIELKGKDKRLSNVME